MQTLYWENQGHVEVRTPWGTYTSDPTGAVNVADEDADFVKTLGFSDTPPIEPPVEDNQYLTVLGVHGRHRIFMGTPGSAGSHR